MDVTAMNVTQERTAPDGLNVRLNVQVSDPLGAADSVVETFLDFFEAYMSAAEPAVSIDIETINQQLKEEFRSSGLDVR